jgi:hypothetical protein
MRQSPGRTRRILVFLGLATFIQIYLFFRWRKDPDLFTGYFSGPDLPTASHQDISDPSGNVTAYSHIIKADAQRYDLIPTLQLPC